jgi:hypothetical protein
MAAIACIFIVLLLVCGCAFLSIDYVGAAEQLFTVSCSVQPECHTAAAPSRHVSKGCDCVPYTRSVCRAVTAV